MQNNNKENPLLSLLFFIGLIGMFGLIALGAMSSKLIFIFLGAVGFTELFIFGAILFNTAKVSATFDEKTKEKIARKRKPLVVTLNWYFAGFAIMVPCVIFGAACDELFGLDIFYPLRIAIALVPFFALFAFFIFHLFSISLSVKKIDACSFDTQAEGIVYKNYTLWKGHRGGAVYVGKNEKLSFRVVVWVPQLEDFVYTVYTYSKKMILDDHKDKFNIFNSGDKVLVEYDSKNPKLCKIVPPVQSFSDTINA